jgi:hypothetical protein
MMIGAIKPVILLPIATMNHLSTEQVEAILLHELAHIRRHDYLLNIFQTIAEALLFFNPFVWLISRVIRREREHCCDDMVISCNASPLSYAQALAILENDRINTNQLALAATGNKNQLLNRIKRIMEMKKSNINSAQLTIIIVAIIAITFSVAIFSFTPSFAQKKAKTDSSDSTAKKKSVYKYKTVTIDSNGRRKEVVKETSGPKGRMKDDDNDEDVAPNRPGSGHGTSYSYSYSYSDNDDMKKMVDDIITIVKDAVGSIDLKELGKEMENAQKEIDNIDWKEIKKEVNKSIDEVNKELNDSKHKKEITVEVRRELEKTKRELEKTMKEMERTKQVRVEARAHGGNNKTVTVVTTGDGPDDAPEAPEAPPAPPALPAPHAPHASHAVPARPAPPAPGMDNNYETMLSKMEKDGLISSSKGYKIEKEDGELYINGQKQPESVYNKYDRYLKYKTVSIKGHDGSLSISIND